MSAIFSHVCLYILIKNASLYESLFDLFQVNSVRLPRHVGDKRMFCGTALIEFSTEEEAEKVLKQSLVYGGVTLELKPK
jgi:lupus La protein